VRKSTTESLSTTGKEKNCLRSALLNTGGDSKASSSKVLKIFILAMRRTHNKIGMALFIHLNPARKGTVSVMVIYKCTKVR